MENMRIRTRNKRLKAEIFILFPEVVSGNYENAALWLCTRRSVVNFHMRDTFSAGGQQLKLNDELLPFLYRMWLVSC